MRLLSLLFIALSLISCDKPSPNTLNIGTIAGPETEIVETAKQVAESKYGLKINVVTFNDYNLPNEALQDGSLDANVYQHLPYLKAAIHAHGYTIQAIGRTFVYPVGLYSKKFHTLSELPDNATIALPNDPSNEERALLMLAEAKLITLKIKGNVDLKDIDTNPKKLKFKEMDAAQLPRVLDDVDAAVINTTFALPAGLRPSHDAIYVESKDSPYANLIVIRRDTTKRQQLNLFVKALNSKEVEDKAKELFGDAAIPAW